ncbi:MAG: glycosyltransferase family 4 protein [Aggregatilineales bacterium]
MLNAQPNTEPIIPASRAILMLTPYLPYPPVSGGRTRSYELIKRLRADYAITLVCFGRPEEQAFDLTPLRDLCEVIVINRAPSPGTMRAALLSLTSIRPVTMRLYLSAAMRETLARLLNERTFGVAHVESFYMLQNLPANLAVPVLLAEPAIEYVAWGRHARVAQPAYQRPALALEASKMRLFEPQAWGAATVVGVMSEVDASIVKRATPGVATALTPNGVDTDHFQPIDVPRDPDSAVYMGDYKYFPNTDAIRYFVREIMPLIRAERPRFNLTLIGKEAPPDLQALGADPASGVRVAGLVDDTRPYLSRSAVFVCPLRSGSGTRFKLLESLACGCPVVSTALGCEGLAAVNGQHMLIADTPRAFADSVLRVLSDGAYAVQLGAQGRAWVTAQHSWDRSASLVRDLYRRLIGSDDSTVRNRKTSRAPGESAS